MGSLLFSSFEVSSQAFYRATRSFAIVNLKPIVPGRKHWQSNFNHWKYSFRRSFLSDVLVIPHRSVPRLADLDGSTKSMNQEIIFRKANLAFLR